MLVRESARFYEHVSILRPSALDGADQGLRIATTQSPLCVVCIFWLDIVSIA
jgi:hypothetical protein